MRVFGVFLAVSLALHMGGVGAYFVKPDVAEIEASAGSASLEIGELFDSMASEDQQAEAEPVEAVTAQPIVTPKVSSAIATKTFVGEASKPVAVTAQQVAMLEAAVEAETVDFKAAEVLTDVPPEDLEAVEKELAEPADVEPAKPAEAKPVEKTAAKPPEAQTAEAQPLEAHPTEVKPAEAKPAEERPETKTAAKPVTAQTAKPVAAVEPVKTLETVKPAEPQETVTTATAVPRPAPKRPEKTVKTARVTKAEPRKAAKPTEVKAKPKKPAKTASKAAPSARKGGKTANKRGTKGQTGGNNGKQTKVAGTAATSNYRGKVISRIKRKQRYPSKERRMRKTGSAVIRFTVNANGQPSNISVSGVKGSAAFGKEVRRMLRAASPLPKFSAGMPKKPVRFNIRVQFRL